MRLFRKLPGGLRDLAVSMVGVKLGDRFLHLGCGDGRLLAALAARVGLTGRAAAVDASDAGVEAGERAVVKNGVLAEVARAPYQALPHDAEAFDVVVIQDALVSMNAAERTACLNEVLRVLRPGGRCLIVERLARGGLAAFFRQPAVEPGYAAGGGGEGALRTAGLVAVRTLSERGGLRFVEGVRPRT